MSTQPNLLCALVPTLMPAHATAIQTLASSGVPLLTMVQSLTIQNNLNLHAAEQAKTQPLNATFTIPAADFAALIAYMRDGGGVLDDNAPLTSDGLGLGQLFWQSVLDADQAAFWPLLVQLAKSWGIVRGRVTPVAGGGTIFNGVGPSGTPGPPSPATTSTAAPIAPASTQGATT
jgi:hypothetical protein